MDILLLVWDLLTVCIIFNWEDLSKSYLLTNAGWGVVGSVEDSYLILTAFHPFSNSVYSSGSWRLVRLEPYHISEIYPLEGGLVFFICLKTDSYMEYYFG